MGKRKKREKIINLAKKRVTCQIKGWEINILWKKKKDKNEKRKCYFRLERVSDDKKEGRGVNWKTVITKIVLSVLMEKLNLQMKAERNERSQRRLK